MRINCNRRIGIITAAQQRKMYTALVQIVIGYYAFKYFASGLLGSVVPNAVISVLFYGILIVLLFGAHKIMRKAISTVPLVLAIAWAVLCFFMACRCTMDKQDYLEHSLYIAVRYIPVFFVGRSICIHEDLLTESIRKLPTVLNVIQVMNSFVFVGLSYSISTNNGSTTIDYSQMMGYASLTAAAISLVDLLLIGGASKKTIINTFVAIVLVLGAGARGPILCMALLTVVVLLYCVASGKHGLLVFATTIGTILFILLYDKLLLAIRPIIVGLGMSTRMVDSILKGTGMRSDGRMFIWNRSIASIIHNPLGYGIFSERIRIYRECAGHVGLTTTSSVGFYPHNIFIEFVLQFGIIFGLLMCAFLIVALLKAFYKCVLSGRFLFCFVFICIGLFPLLLSDSYVDFQNFYLLIGYLSLFLKKKRKDRKKNDESALLSSVSTR